MNILFLSHNFPPETNALASRTYEHAKLWVKMGHQVEVVTCAPNHPRGVLYEGYRNALFQRERMDGIDVSRVWTYVAANEGVGRRSLNYSSFLISATLQAARLTKPDVVVSSSPQFFSGLVGYPVSRLKRVPWVLEIRDLWPESVVAVEALRRGLAIRSLEAMERFAYRHADHIVSVTNSFLTHFDKLGVPLRKVSVVTNGADLEQFSEPVRNEALAAELGLRDKFVAAYVGTHGMAHALSTVLQAADRLRARDDIRFLLVGSGAEQEQLRQQRDEMGLKNVVMLDQQPRQRMPMMWGLASAAVVHLRNTPLFRSVIPSKIFEAMAMGLPILHGVEGESAEIVSGANAGICFEPENAQALADAVIKLADDRSLARALGESGRRVVRERYDRKVLAERYLDILQRVAHGAPQLATA